jgi:hypothetical protein
VVVRVAKGDPVGLATALDAGASAIVMPHTETAEEVREMIKEVYYREFPSTNLTYPQRPNTGQPPWVSAPSARGPSPPASRTSPSTKTTTGT